MTPREKALSKNKKLIIIISLVAIAFCVGGIFVPGLILVGLIVALLLTTEFYERKKIKRSYCPTCGNKYEYETDVSWDTLSVITKNTTRESRLRFNCTCSICGNKTEFAQSFTTASIDKNGNLVEYNIYDRAKKYFK